MRELLVSNKRETEAYKTKSTRFLIKLSAYVAVVFVKNNDFANNRDIICDIFDYSTIEEQEEL